MAIFTTLRGGIHDSIWHKLQNSMEVDSVGIIAILSMSYINTRVVKNIDKCGKNPQSARRKPNYHTTCGKNCHKILSVCIYLVSRDHGYCLKGSFFYKRGFSLLNFERGLKKNYVLPNLETLCSYSSLLDC